MRHTVMILMGALLTLAATTAGSQEIQLDSEQRNRLNGTVHYVDLEHSQIVVNDMTYSLGEAVWIDGTRHRVEQLKELVDLNETVELEFSGQGGNGDRRVTRIHTNP